MLHINNATKNFSGNTILNNINFNVKAHSIVGLAGPSGSGKSTLLRCIQQLDTLDSGEITCAGTCGFMFQDFQLFPHMNVFNNLIYAPNLHKKDNNTEEVASAFLKKLGIENKALSFPNDLSGGQKQRVALARTLMMEPDLLLCDEPTSGLDMGSIDDVISLLQSVKNMKITMIIASHDLRFLTQISDRIVVLKKGKLVADFQPQDILDPISFVQNHYQGE